MSEPNILLDWQPFDIGTISKKKFPTKCVIHMLTYNRIDQTKKSLMFLTTEDKVYSFGLNKSNCLALPSTIPSAGSVRPIPELSDKKIIKFIAGNCFGVALLSTGRLLTWGLNQFGQLGIGPTRTSIYKPTEVIELASHKIVEVCCGACHVLALTSLSYLFAWGSNTSGAVGNGSLRHQFTPVCLTQISTQPTICGGMGLNLVLSISAGGWQSACIDITGSLHVWGTQSNKSEPITTPKWIKTYGQDKQRLQAKKVVCGRTHVLAITFNDIVLAFGSNDLQQCLPDSKQANFSVDDVQVVPFVDEPMLIQTFTNLDISIAVNSQYYFIWGSYEDDWLQKLIKVNNLPPNFTPLPSGPSATTKLLVCGTHFTSSALNFKQAYLERRKEEYITLLINPKIKEAFHISMFNDPQDAEYCFQFDDDSIYISKRIIDSYGKSLLAILSDKNENFSVISPKVGHMHRYQIKATIERDLVIQYLVSLHTGQMLIREKDLIKLIQLGEKQIWDESIVEACFSYIQNIYNGQLLSDWYNELELLECSKDASRRLIEHFNSILDEDLGKEIRREMFMYSVRLTAGTTLFDEPYHKIMLSRDRFDENLFPPGTSREAFLWYLHFMYIGFTDENFNKNCPIETIGQVYMLAVQLDNETLKNRCLSIITNRLAIENCCRIYITCKQIADADLIKIVLKFVNKNLATFIASADFRWMITNNEAILKDFMLELNIYMNNSN